MEKIIPGCYASKWSHLFPICFEFGVQDRNLTFLRSQSQPNCEWKTLLKATKNIRNKAGLTHE